MLDKNEKVIEKSIDEFPNLKETLSKFLDVCTQKGMTDDEIRNTLETLGKDIKLKVK